MRNLEIILVTVSQYAKEGRLFLETSRNVSNVKAKTLPGWKPVANNEKIVLDSVESMIKDGIIPEPNYSAHSRHFHPSALFLSGWLRRP